LLESVLHISRCCVFYDLSPVVSVGWTPTLLVGKGIDVKTASFGLALFNFGGVAGCLVAAWAIGWFGSRVGILTMAGGAVLGAVLLALLPLSPSNDVLIKVLLCVEGFFLLGAQGSLYALATYVYPTAIRSTWAPQRALAGPALLSAPKSVPRPWQWGPEPSSASSWSVWPLRSSPSRWSISTLTQSAGARMLTLCDQPLLGK
jgi:hypothetical protein